MESNSYWVQPSHMKEHHIMQDATGYAAYKPLYSHPQKQHFLAHATFPFSTIMSHFSICSIFLFMSHILSFPLPSFHGCGAPGITQKPSAKVHLLAWSCKSISTLKNTCMQSKILLLYGHFGSCCTIQVKWQVLLIKAY